MKFTIVVDEPDDYVAWYAAQKPVSQNADMMASFKHMSEQTGLGKGGSKEARASAIEETGEQPCAASRSSSLALEKLTPRNFILAYGY
ncbi:MAG: hypothetical protein WKG07_15750 [Hymenobacter sp.]